MFHWVFQTDLDQLHFDYQCVNVDYSIQLNSIQNGTISKTLKVTFGMLLLDWVPPPIFSAVPELPVLDADFCVKRMQTVDYQSF